jgi:hypothetical protein
MTQTKAELLETKHQGDIRLGDANSSHYVGFKAPATVGTSLVWTLPAADGSANQFLQTNASGVLGWGTADVSSAMPLSGGTFTGDVTFSGASANIVFDKSDNALEFADNARAFFGASSDLQIYHNNHNYITSTNGDLICQAPAGNWFYVKTDAGNDNSIIAKNNGSVELYHNNVKKLHTSAAGAYITGALTVSTDATITGDLTVSGTTTTINTQTLDVEDKNIVIGKVSSPSDTTADGGGITLKGASDKTINWINSTDAWTFSEHINIASGKKLGVGGANYGTSGQVLTSGGSSTHPSWTTISAAPQITATANGSIAANTAVVVRSDGDVEDVVETVTINTVFGSEFDTGNGNQARNSVAYDPNKDQWVTAYANVYQTQGYPYYRISATNDTFGSSNLILNEKCVETDLVYHDGEEAMVVFYVRNAGTPRGVARVLYSKNSGSVGNALEFFEAFNSHGWVYDSASTRLVGHVQRFQSTPYLNVLIQLSVNSDNTLTDQGDTTITTDRCNYGSIAIGNGYILLSYQKENNKTYVKAYKWNSSTSSYAASSEVQATTQNANFSAVGYCTKDEKFVLIFVDNDTSDALRGCFITVTGSTTPSVSVGTISNAGEPTSVQKPNMYYDSGIGELVAYYVGGAGSAGRAKVKRVNSTGSNFAWVSGETSMGSSAQNWPAGYIRSPIAYGTVDSKAMTLWHDNNQTKARTVQLGTSTTNLTTSNFIGFSDGSATADDGTCTVNVVGNTTTQSSLTAGQNYYVQTNGSLSTVAATPSVLAGTALSATKLLIKPA